MKTRKKVPRPFQNKEISILAIVNIEYQAFKYESSKKFSYVAQLYICCKTIKVVDFCSINFISFLMLGMKNGNLSIITLDTLLKLILTSSFFYRKTQNINTNIMNC